MFSVEMKKCSNCVYSISDEYGYSNYTVEGTTLYCAKSMNSEMPFDRWYGEDKRDVFAETCHMYCQGTGVAVDCDQDYKVKSDDPEIKWGAYLNGYVTGSDIDRVSS